MSVPDLIIKRERLIAGTTLRLTAERPIAASRCKNKTYTREKRIFALIWGTLGDSLRHSLEASRADS